MRRKSDLNNPCSRATRRTRLSRINRWIKQTHTIKEEQRIMTEEICRQESQQRCDKRLRKNLFGTRLAREQHNAHAEDNVVPKLQFVTDSPIEDELDDVILIEKPIETIDLETDDCDTSTNNNPSSQRNVDTGQVSLDEVDLEKADKIFLFDDDSEDNDFSVMNYADLSKAVEEVNKLVDKNTYYRVPTTAKRKSKVSVINIKRMKIENVLPNVDEVQQINSNLRTAKVIPVPALHNSIGTKLALPPERLGTRVSLNPQRYSKKDQSKMSTGGGRQEDTEEIFVYESYDDMCPKKVGIKIRNDDLSRTNIYSQQELINKYVPNSNNILPHDVQNDTQHMHSYRDLAEQPYSSFKINSYAHREFEKQFYENDFGHSCDICDRLFFKKDLKKFAYNDTTVNIQFIKTMLSDVNVAEVKICANCLKTIKQIRVPQLAVYIGFKYPPVPEILQKNPLDSVTERFLYMQIQRLQHTYYDKALNFGMEVNTMKSEKIVDDKSITGDIKRGDRHTYDYGAVDKRKIKVWWQYLNDMTLHSSYGITVDDSFFKDDVQNETVSNENGNKDFSKKIHTNESLVTQQQKLMCNGELYSTIAPEESNITNKLLPYAEELSFPQIYYGQVRTFRDGYVVTPFMVAASELRRTDRRGVTPQHLLYLALKLIRIRLRNLDRITFKSLENSTTITKKQIQSKSYLQSCIESSLASLRLIPNSTHYWLERKNELFAMIRQYGKPTVFFTISANYIRWPKLLQLLYKLKNNCDISVKDVAALDIIKRTTLVHEDAITCAIYFNKLVNVLMKILQSKRFNPFKEYRILNYFKSIEFQHRGSPEAHILAWLDNAPKDSLGKDYSKAINLIDFLISVSTAEASGNIDLQIHKHTLKCNKRLSSKILPKCRCDAPFLPIKMTMILTPMEVTEDGFKEYKAKYNDLRKNLENYDYDDFQTFYAHNNINSDQEYVNIIRAGINRPKVFPKRQPDEKMHSPFNPFILNIVKSNTDFQFITDEYSCAAYVMEYVRKANRGVSDLQSTIIEIMDGRPEYDLCILSKNICTNFSKHIKMTSQEAAWYLLEEPLSKSSIPIVYIPTVWPSDRQTIKKSMNESSELEDIGKEYWFDKYQKRPENLKNVSLAQFVSKYSKRNKNDYVERDEPRIIRYCNYDIATDLDEHKREMVTLHVPFRHEETEILKDMKFIRLYNENLDLISQMRRKFESNPIEIEKILQICQELMCKEEDDEEEKVGEDIIENSPSEDTKVNLNEHILKIQISDVRTVKSENKFTTM